VLVGFLRDAPIMNQVAGLGADVSEGSFFAIDVPKRAVAKVLEYLESRESMRERIQRLEDKNLMLSARAQRMEALTAENMRYRALLNSPVAEDTTMTVARIVAVSPDVNRHLLTLDRGESDGVNLGHPVLNAEGVMGQIIQVGKSASRALLVTDVQHGIPVINNRTGQRAIAEGVGRLSQLVIRNLASTSDVLEDDLWVTSGLGERFPAGYPVGVTRETTTSGDAAYLSVTLQPMAALDVESHVLIVTSSDSP
jgi:rod shape-determining protein MreC